MPRSDFYNLDSRSGVAAIARLRQLGHRVGLHGVHPDATLDDRFDPVIAWHTPEPEYMSAPIAGAVNVMQAGYFDPARYRSDSNQHWRSGCPHEELAAGSFEWLQLLVHPEIWVYPGATMRETMDRSSTRSASCAGRSSPRTESISRERQALRVLHCPVNTAGIPWANLQALRRRGIESDLLVFNRYKLHPEADISLERQGGLLRQQAMQWRAFLSSCRATTSSTSTRASRSCRSRCSSGSCTRSGRRASTSTSARTSAARRPSSSRTGKRRTPRSSGATTRSAGCPRRTSSFPASRSGDRAGAAVPTASEARHPPRAVVSPPQGNGARRRGVRRAGRGLRDRGGPAHDEAFERYRKADIVVDQLNAGWYGVFAIECLALGKPVVTFLHDEAVRRTKEAYGVEVPVVSATAETLRERLRPLVADAALRHRIGAASRAYAERVHDIEAIAGQLLELYGRI